MAHRIARTMALGQAPRPFFVLVGRPNVGKSTLFNRLIGQQQAVVCSAQGTTRDRLYGRVEWRGRTVTIVDTGGVEHGAVGDEITNAVQRQVQYAINEADGIIVVCDAQAGLVPADLLLVDRLRPLGKPMILAVNKADHQLLVPPEFFSLGLDPVIAISALHGRGIPHLLDAIDSLKAQHGQAVSVTSPTRSLMVLAILGRQNVGKSSLLNALLREPRAIISDAPGTTRDVLVTQMSVNGTPLVVMDTAGVRHRRKVRQPVDIFSMARTREAIQHCDVALIVLDASQGVTRDDQRIVQHVCDSGSGMILLLNKWDLIKGMPARALAQMMHRALPQASGAPIVAVSAKTGFHINQIVPAAQRVWRAIHYPWTEERCTAMLQTAWAAHAPPRVMGRAIRLHSARWMSGRPVRLELTTSPLGRLPRAYQHYLLKRLARRPECCGVPIRLVIRVAGARSRHQQGHVRISPMTGGSS